MQTTNNSNNSNENDSREEYESYEIEIENENSRALSLLKQMEHDISIQLDKYFNQHSSSTSNSHSEEYFSQKIKYQIDFMKNLHIRDLDSIPFILEKFLLANEQVLTAMGLYDAKVKLRSFLIISDQSEALLSSLEKLEEDNASVESLNALEQLCKLIKSIFDVVEDEQHNFKHHHLYRYSLYVLKGKFNLLTKKKAFETQERKQEDIGIKLNEMIEIKEKAEPDISELSIYTNPADSVRNDIENENENQNKN